MDFFAKLFSSSPASSSNPVIPDALKNVQKRYSFDQVIGQGSFGVVRKCQDRKTKEWFACKSIAKNMPNTPPDELRHAIQREVENIRAVQHIPTRNGGDGNKKNIRHQPHPHLVELIDVYEDSKYVHLITELCTGGELYDQVLEWKRQRQLDPSTPVDEITAAVLLHGILDALSYLHDVHHMAHRDLKASNFLFWKPGSLHIKIIDFGLSRTAAPKARPLVYHGKVDDKRTMTTANKMEVDENSLEDENDYRRRLPNNHTELSSQDDSSNFEGYISAFSTPIPSIRDATADLFEEDDETNIMKQFAKVFACNDATITEEDDSSAEGSGLMNNDNNDTAGFDSSRSTPIPSERNEGPVIEDETTRDENGENKNHSNDPDAFANRLVNAFTCSADTHSDSEEPNASEDETVEKVPKIDTSGPTTDDPPSSTVCDAMIIDGVTAEEHTTAVTRNNSIESDTIANRPVHEATDSGTSSGTEESPASKEDEEEMPGTDNSVTTNEALPLPETVVPSWVEHDDPLSAARSYYGTMTSEVGTPYYVAPEVLLDDEYTCLCDVWSIGVIAFLMLSGKMPFQGADERETVRLLMKHTTVDFPQEQWGPISKEAQDFCRQLLQKDPSKRPSARQALLHPWMIRYCGNSKRFEHS